ncbi:MAG: hypothetical protein RBU21_05275 [FCB group bacterium]|jgi:hypothetical protein|nr:hypothetical protein [FCB group bacterium]
MLHLAVVALLGTLMLAQQPPEQVRSTDLPGSVSAPAKTPAAPAPAASKASDNSEPVQADSADNSNAPKPLAEPPVTPPPAAAPAAAPAAPPAPAPPAAPPAAGGKRVAAFWMMLPKGP